MWSTLYRFTLRNINIQSTCVRGLKILGIETSCDDTGCAIVDETGKILGHALNSQEEIHLRYGGIIPPIARDLHQEHIQAVFEEAMKRSNLLLSDIDAISATVKPGLPLSLLIGMKLGKQLSLESQKPFIPIHHMEAHALTVRMVEKVPFPFLVLLISGGHCLISLVKDVDDFVLLGESLDDAPGEAFDKVARRLKLRNLSEFRNMSGGRAMEMASLKGDSKRFAFTTILSKEKDCNFSFSGLKCLALRHILEQEKEHGIEGDGLIPGLYDLCASFQYNVTKHLCRRLQRACVFCEINNLLPVENRIVVVSGGVACNSFIKDKVSQVCSSLGFQLVAPPPYLCTDNGVMIAWNGVERWKAKAGVISPDNLDSVDIKPKCQLGVSWIKKVREAQIKCKWIHV